MRVLAIDLGDRRTGFASGDDVVFIVQPLAVVARCEARPAVAKIDREEAHRGRG